MALVTTQGFDHQAGAADLVATVATTGDRWKWSTLRLAAPLGSIFVPGRFGGKALSLGVVDVFGGTLDAPFAGAAAILGCAVRVPAGGNCLIGFWDSASQDPLGGTMQLSVLLDGTDRHISIYRGSPASGTLLHATATGQFAVTGWVYVELWPVIDAVGGTIALQLRGFPYLSLAGLNTQAGGAARIDSLFFGGNGGAFVDDVYIADTTAGPGINPFNDFQGDVRVFTRFPKSPGIAAQFTPLAGANFSQVSELAMDSDASYNYDSGSPAGHKDLFVADPLPAGAMPLACRVEGAYRRSNTSGTLYQIVNKLLSGSTEVDGAPVTLFPDYTYQSDIYPQNPNGLLAWDGVSVNASQIGYEVTSTAPITPPPPAPPPPPSLLIEIPASSVTVVGPGFTQTGIITLTTAHPNDIIVLHAVIYTAVPSSAPAVSSVTGGGLVWNRRSRVNGGLPSGNAVDSETWWALAPSPLAATDISVTVTSPIAFLVMTAFGVSGADITSPTPWDTDPSLPAIATNLTTTSSVPQVTGVSTANSRDLILFQFDDLEFLGSVGPPPGFSGVILVGAGNGFSIDVQSWTSQEVVSAPLSAATLGIPIMLPLWLITVDALRAA